jgi:hypothetical protein
VAANSAAVLAAGTAAGSEGQELTARAGERGRAVPVASIEPAVELPGPGHEPGPNRSGTEAQELALGGQGQGEQAALWLVRLSGLHRTDNKHASAPRICQQTLGKYSVICVEGPGAIAAKILTHRDGPGSELICLGPEYLVGGHSRDSIQKRAPGLLGRFIPICIE